MRYGEQKVNMSEIAQIMTDEFVRSVAASEAADTRQIEDVMNTMNEDYAVYQRSLEAARDLQLRAAELYKESLRLEDQAQHSYAQAMKASVAALESFKRGKLSPQIQSVLGQLS